MQLLYDVSLLGNAGLVSLLLYTATILLFSRVLRTRSSHDDGNARPGASVVIAARNEAENIGACLDSVCRQSYRSEEYEVIVVDDESTDDTKRIILEKAKEYSNIRLVSVSPEPALRGKGRALAQGIDKATREIILITDADCVVPATWIEETARRYVGDVGLIGGVTLQRSRNAFEGMQSLDWTYLLGISAATSTLGVSYGSIGNNLSFRRAAYDAVGGYRNIGFSITEDFALVRAILQRTKWRQLYPVDPTVAVESAACPDWKTLIRQKHRWGRGGLDVPLSGFVFMAVAWSAHVIPLLLIFNEALITFGSTILLLKAATEYVFVRRMLMRLERLDDLRWFWAFELWLACYVIALPFMAVFGRTVHWKGRSFS